MPTTVKENYLKALFFLSDDDGRINITELSKRLGVSKPTASNMIKNLEGRGWVIYQKYKPVILTEKGRKTAALVVRKHRLTEMFLHKIMGFGWDEVHEIAEQMEHLDSETFFSRMDEMLNYPVIDPHGSPIPDKDGNIAKHHWVPLAHLGEGKKCKVTAIANSATELLQYLNQCSIELGTVIEVIKIEPFDGSCHVSCDGRPPILISPKVAENLLVDEV